MLTMRMSTAALVDMGDLVTSAVTFHERVVLIYGTVCLSELWCAVVLVGIVELCKRGCS
jgi:hypothetical protein